MREKSGLFDRSYLTRVLILGPNAAVCVQRITTNDVSEMAEGDCEYTLVMQTRAGSWMTLSFISGMRKPLA